MNNVPICPDPETLAALIDGRLDASLAQTHRAHVARCGECFAVVRGTLHVLSREDADRNGLREFVRQRSRRGVHSFRWALSLAAAVVLLAGLGAAWWLRPPDLVAQLAGRFDSRRPVEGRLIGFPHAPPDSALRGGEDSRSPREDWRVLEIVSKIDARAAGDAPSAEALRARGLGALVLGRHDEAVAAFEAALRREPDNVRVLSDLSAAYLARADAADSAEDRVRAIDAAEHAIALDPRLPEARFNLAVALEQQVLLASGVDQPDAGRAIRAWNDYLSLDAASPWASEARDRLRRLTERRSRGLLPTEDEVERAAAEGDTAKTRALVSLLPRAGRAVLERRLLSEWADAALAGRRDDAGRALATSRRLADVLTEVTGDPLARDAVDFVAATGIDGGRAGRLARSLVDYRDGIRLHDQDRMAEAAPHFAAARDGMAALGFPLQWSAGLYLAIALYYEGPREGSERAIAAIEAALAARSCPSLLARVRSMKGLLQAVRGDLSESLLAYESARDLYAAAGEPDGTAHTESLIAENLALLGDREDAWEHRARAFASADRVPPDHLGVIVLEASFAARAEDLPWAALGFLGPALERSADLPPADRAELHLARAPIESGLGDAHAADADLEAALRIIAAVADPGLRQRLTAEQELARGAAIRSTDPEAALASLQDALDYFAKEDAQSRLPVVELETGLALERLGRAEEAVRHDERGLDALDRLRARLSDEARQIGLFERSAELYDALIGLEATALANPDRALVSAERARRAELGVDRDRRDGSIAAAAVTMPAAFRHAGPSRRVLLSFVALKTRLLCWVSSDGGWVFRPGPIGSDALGAIVSELGAAVAAEDEVRFRRCSERLYDVLLRPVEDLLPAEGELRILPDRSLGEVPFAALVDSRSGRYLAERFAVAIAPSLSFSERRPAGPAAGAVGGLLVVADPAFDAKRFPGLQRLPDSAATGRTLAREDPAATLLIGPDATPANFLRAAATSEVLHFSGHAFFNERAPLYSALVLAPDMREESTGLLTVDALRRADLSHLRLVVLGACRAGAGRRSRSAGALGLSRPFLMAGVPEIVAPLWAVRDREAERLLSAFHHGIGLGRNPVESLHEAQLAALRNEDSRERSPIAWGAFEVNSTVLN